MTAAARTRLVIAALALLTAALFAGSLLVGPAGFGMGESLRALLSGQGDAIALVMREIRLPRALLALLIGAGLGASGATLQGYLRNPLAEPGLQQLLEEHHVGWTLLSADSVAVQLLDRDPRWREFYRDGIAVIHVPAGSQGS